MVILIMLFVPYFDLPGDARPLWRSTRGHGIPAGVKHTQKIYRRLYFISYFLLGENWSEYNDCDGCICPSSARSECDDMQCSIHSQALKRVWALRRKPSAMLLLTKICWRRSAHFFLFGLSLSNDIVFARRPHSFCNACSKFRWGAMRMWWAGTTAIPDMAAGCRASMSPRSESTRRARIRFSPLWFVYLLLCRIFLFGGFDRLLSFFFLMISLFPYDLSLIDSLSLLSLNTHL